MIHNRPILFLLVLTLTLLFLVSCTTAPPPDTTAEDLQAINAKRKQYANDFNQGDAAVVAAHYTEEAKYLPPNSPMIVGREGIQAYIQGGFDAGVGNFQLTMTDLQVYGDMAHDIGKYTLTIQPEEGAAISDNGKYLVILKRVNGTWQLDAVSLNTSLPLPVPEALPTAEEEE